jgi:2-oxopent-4-enoate/cis-2-oxohex-4-enoate hydratase
MSNPIAARGWLELKYQNILEALQNAERTRVAIGPVSEMTPGGLTLDDAKAINEEGIRQRLERGEKIAGYKVGFTNMAVRQKMGLPGSTYGYILDTMVMKSGDTCRMDELVGPKVETEICFKLKSKISASDLTVEKVMDATEGVRPSFEICDARIKDWKCPYQDFFADNGFSARIVLGGDNWIDPKSVDLREVTDALYKDGEKIAEGKGSNALDHPANAVIWLAQELAKRNKTINAGEFIMTGTLTPILPAKSGEKYRAVFTPLGEVSVTFV